MSNYVIQRNMVTMTEQEFRRLMVDLEEHKTWREDLLKMNDDLNEYTTSVVDERDGALDRVKLLEDTLRATEKELKELRAKQAADELTVEAQRLGLYK